MTAGPAATAATGTTATDAAALQTRAAIAARLTPALLRIGRRIRPTSGELAGGHFSLLATLERRGPQRPSDLARIERFSPPAVARAVGALADRGLVVRSPSPDDARSSLVHITAAGAALLESARADQASAVTGLLAALDDEQLEALGAALDALERVAAEASGGPDDGRSL